MLSPTSNGPPLDVLVMTILGTFLNTVTVSESVQDDHGWQKGTLSTLPFASLSPAVIVAVLVKTIQLAEPLLKVPGIVKNKFVQGLIVRFEKLGNTPEGTNVEGS